MVMLKSAHLSMWSYTGHVRYLRESKSYLFYLHATSKMKFTFVQINMKQVSYKDETCAKFHRFHFRNKFDFGLFMDS